MGKYLPDRIDAINGFKGLLALHILVSEYLVSIYLLVAILGVSLYLSNDIWRCKN